MNESYFLSSTTRARVRTYHESCHISWSHVTYEDVIFLEQRNTRPCHNLFVRALSTTTSGSRHHSSARSSTARTWAALHLCVCLFVCVWVRERESVCACVRVRERDRERERKRERERECVYVCVCVPCSTSELCCTCPQLSHWFLEAVIVISMCCCSARTARICAVAAVAADVPWCCACSTRTKARRYSAIDLRRSNPQTPASCSRVRWCS